MSALKRLSWEDRITRKCEDDLCDAEETRGMLIVTVITYAVVIGGALLLKHLGAM